LQDPSGVPGQERTSQSELNGKHGLANAAKTAGWNTRLSPGHPGGGESNNNKSSSQSSRIVIELKKHTQKKPEDANAHEDATP